MRQPLLIVLFLCWAACSGALGHGRTVEQKLKELDDALEQKAVFDAHKEERMSLLRKNLVRATSGAEQWEVMSALFREYESYKSDSAFAYANRLYGLAVREGDRDKLLQAGCAKVFCLLSTGFFKEAFDVAAQISLEGVSQKSLANYYEIMARLHYSIADYNYEPDWRPGYIADGNAYVGQLLSLLDRQSDDWHYHHADSLMKSDRTSESIGEFSYLMGRDIDIHRRAIVASCLGWMYMQNGESDKAVENLAEAAVCDLRSSTKETTALRMLADMLSREGEIDRPTRYVRESFEDANFYDARLRKIEVGAILPIIEKNRNESLQQERNLLLGSIFVAVVFILASGFVILFIRRQNRKLDRLNARLAEADAIKTAYIGNSFYLNAEYIDKISVLYKTVDRMLVARQYEELRRSVKESAIAKERDQMYEAFDTTFLKIFPTFAENYNALFKEEDREVPSRGLSTEMRIFALIRLGITESDRIAKFLNYSVHTINTYKTRVKNKSVVENDQFEEAIMRIGTK